MLPHGGVHSNFNTAYAHIIKELTAQEYVVIAPDYQGGTGYGQGFYQLIDYGGLEVEDTKSCRGYMRTTSAFNKTLQIWAGATAV